MTQMTSTAKAIALAALAVATATGAQAESRFNPRKMQCEDVQQVIRANGAVTLRYTSARVRNLPLYNRYVRNSAYCAPDEFASPANVPTLDNPDCRVNICEHRSNDDERDWLLFPMVR
jgi:hypothetical protein